MESIVELWWTNMETGLFFFLEGSHQRKKFKGDKEWFCPGGGGGEASREVSR